jgi:hypothetical protein
MGRRPDHDPEVALACVESAMKRLSLCREHNSTPRIMRVCDTLYASTLSAVSRVSSLTLSGRLAAATSAASERSASVEIGAATSRYLSVTRPTRRGAPRPGRETASTSRGVTTHLPTGRRALASRLVAAWCVFATHPTLPNPPMNMVDGARESGGARVRPDCFQAMRCPSSNLAWEQAGGVARVFDDVPSPAATGWFVFATHSTQ